VAHYGPPQGRWDEFFNGVFMHPGSYFQSFWPAAASDRAFRRPPFRGGEEAGTPARPSAPIRRIGVLEQAVCAMWQQQLAEIKGIAGPE